MKAKIKVAVFFLLIGLTRANADLNFTVTDLGTLGGNMSSASGYTSGGANNAGMLVGGSTMSDNSEHAFLYYSGQMFDLNTLCDLSQSDFKVLTVAKAINDSCLITGEGITTNGEKHAFLLTPLEAAGGQWSYACCQWVWIQDGGGWWWESNCGCYRWHGPPGRHPPCPPEPPPCWWFPLPCPPPCHRPPPERTPIPTPTPTLPPPVRRTPTPTPSITGVPVGVLPTPTPQYTGIPVGVLPTPTPQYTGIPVGVLPTPTPRYTGHTVGAKPTPTPRKFHGRGTSGGTTTGSSSTSTKLRGGGTPGPSNGPSTSTKSTRTGKTSSTTRGKPTPTPKP
jgi:probable HAF family extracellular repeat protein